MTRIMRDSVTPGDITITGAQLFAGYVNGANSQWPGSAWGAFPAGSIVTIDVNGERADADVLDVETGDASVTTAVDWVRKKRSLYPNAFLPVLYANRSTLTPLFNALEAAGLHVAHDFKIWIATLDGTTKTVPDMTGVVAVQWKPAASTSGAGHYDESVVYDDTWKPALPPPVTAIHGVVVQLPSGATQIVSSSDGGHTWR